MIRCCFIYFETSIYQFNSKHHNYVCEMKQLRIKLYSEGDNYLIPSKEMNYGGLILMEKSTISTKNMGKKHIT